MVFLKHVQQNAVPQLFLELCQGKYQSNIPTFKIMILFLDARNILRTFSLSSHQCSQINYNYLMSHVDEAKYFVPTPKNNRIFAIKLWLCYHIKHKCAGVTYLNQSFSQYFHVQNMRTICFLAFNLCHVCFIRRLIRQKRFVQEPIYTYPKNVKFLLNQIICKTL